jgi:hypothetical protein
MSKMRVVSTDSPSAMMVFVPESLALAVPDVAEI